MTRVGLAFRSHPLAIAGLVVLALLYLGALLADVLAPYHYDDESRAHSWAPPSRIHVRDHDGSWHRPFIRQTTYRFDENALRIWAEDSAAPRAPIRLWAACAPYRLLGILPMKHRLLGVEGPARVYLMGADSRGRDLFSRLLYGSRISLTIGLVGVAVATSIALLVGGIAGLFGGAVDSVLMRVCEIVMLVPGFYLMMLLRAAIPLDWSSVAVYFSIVLILSFVGWAGLARVIRGMVLSIRAQDFVASARALGAPWHRILARHVLPQTFGYVAVTCTLSIPGYIIAESALSLLGLGIQDPQTSWGNLLSEAMAVSEIRLHPWSLLPGFFIFLAVMAYNFVGDALRDALDPQAHR